MTQTRGGRRKGAGRPKSKERRVPLCIQLLPATNAELREESENTGQSISSTAETAIKNYFTFKHYLDKKAFQRKLEEIEAWGRESQKIGD